MRICNGSRWCTVVVVQAILGALCGNASAQSIEQRLIALEKRVAFLEAQAGISNAPSASQQASISRTPVTTPASVSASQVPVSSRIVTKKTVKAEETGSSDELRFYVEFKNRGTRDITAIDGDLVIKNISAQTLLEFGMSAVKYIAAGDSAIWIGAVDYDTKDAGHRAIDLSDKNYLIVELKPETITYSDGTIDRYKK